MKPLYCRVLGPNPTLTINCQPEEAPTGRPSPTEDIEASSSRRKYFPSAVK